VTSPGVDDTATGAFFAEFGAAARSLPPVAIVIAAFNEAGVARAHGALVCDVPVNRGQGAALRLGYRLAREGGARYIVTTDADGQYNPAEMERVLAPVVAGEADFVTGSRKLGSQETNDPVRRLGTWVFAVTISLLTRQHITDSSFGLRAMRAEVTGAVRLEQPQYQSSELLIAVLAHGFRVAEVPATIHKRQVGESKKGHNAIYGLKFAGVVLGTWWRERQRRVPGSGSAPRSGDGRLADDRSAGPSAQDGEPPRRAPEPLAASGPDGTGPSSSTSGTPAASAAETTESDSLDPRSAKRR